MLGRILNGDRGAFWPTRMPALWAWLNRWVQVNVLS